SSRTAKMSGDGIGKVRVAAKAKRIGVKVRPGAGSLKLHFTLSAKGAKAHRTLTVKRAARTAFQAALGGVSPSGVPSKRMALEAFSLAFGKLPGVQVPTG